MNTPDFTILFPCLNEEKTIGVCLEKAMAVVHNNPQFNIKVMVSDNGSTDRSKEIIRSFSEVILNEVPIRGYGSALISGIKASQSKYVIFMDSDDTYPIELAPKLYEKAVEVDADMVIASRLNGEIEEGAMPWLHQYVGTPILTGLINLLFKTKMTDCNSGYRCIKKTAFDKWGVKTPGMEFASELIIRACVLQAKIVEIQGKLLKCKYERTPHLNTFRDGALHFIRILKEWIKWNILKKKYHPDSV
jgi:glycosyltransferase involved in cell wall biosynthesis